MAGKVDKWLTKEGLLRIEGWARDGLTEEQIAANMGIGRTTLYNYKTKHQRIEAALVKGKEVVDRQVENALLKAAIGFEYQEVTKEPIFEENPLTGLEEEVMRVTKIVTKQVSPNTTAAIFWLKNRKPHEYRDKQVVEHSGNVRNKIDLSSLSVEELRNLAKETQEDTE